MEYLPIVAITISSLVAIITIGSTIFYAGKWAGTQDYVHKELASIHRDLEALESSIKELIKEAKDDRHKFRGEIQTWQQKFLDDEKIWHKEIRHEINGRFDRLSCILPDKDDK